MESQHSKHENPFKGSSILHPDPSITIQTASPQNNIRSHYADEKNYKKKLRETYFEKVYPHIEKYTFKSAYIPLTKGQLLAIREKHEEFRKTSEKYNWLTNQELIKLEQQIDATQQKLGVEYLFVRISSRSPKDAALNTRRFDGLFAKELRHLEDFESFEALSDPSLAPTTMENRKIHAVSSAANLALACPNGKESVQVLVESERIQGDVQESVDDNVPLSLVLREFRAFNIELEFRGFVVNKKLTALTQSNEFCYFPQLVYKKNYISDAIKDFMKEQLFDAIPINSYIIDFIGISSSKSALPPYEIKFMVVELNPFGEITNAGLFKWDNPHDSEVLKGTKPFEFRIATEPIKDIGSKIPDNWKSIISFH